MKYEWMFFLAIIFCFIGGYNLSDNLLQGIILIEIGLLILVIKWNLQDIIRKSEGERT